MQNLSGEKMEQVMLGVVSVVVVVCATFLGYNGKGDPDAVLTSIAAGLFGYSGMASRQDSKKEESKTKEKAE